MDPGKDGHKGHDALCPVCGGKFWQRRDGRPVTCSRVCARRKERDARGGHPPNWKGGRWVINTGYVKILKPGHPRADKRGYVLEHLVVMEGIIERPVERHETVHHRNGKRDDNRPENLELHAGPHARGATSPHCPTCTCLAHAA